MIIEVPELAISLVQPMGTAVVRGWKPVENRTWRPTAALGKTVAVHASARWDVGYWHTVQRLAPLGACECAEIDNVACPRSAIVGVARVTGWVRLLDGASVRRLVAALAARPVRRRWRAVLSQASRGRSAYRPKPDS